MDKKRIAIDIPWPVQPVRLSHIWESLGKWLPGRGNVLFTLLVVAGLFWVQNASALSVQQTSLSSASGTIAYQGRLADGNGQPIAAATHPMVFRLYASAAADAIPLWTENWTGSSAVEVSDGLFNVMLGSLEPIPQSVITGNDSLYLGISVGSDDEMTPRIQLGTVPYAAQALTVPDGSITTVKIADGVVTYPKLALPNDSVCGVAQIDVNVPSEWTGVPVPGLTLTLSLPAPGEVLIWSSGTYHFDAQVHYGTAIFINGEELGRVSELYAGGWSNYSIMRSISLPAGTHTLALHTFAQQPGMVAYSSETCLNYLVVS